MKLTNEDAKVIWFVFGKLTLGCILAGVGLVTALNGAANWGGASVIATMYDADPEGDQKIADKITD